jgi:hypothetical protein
MKIFTLRRASPFEGCCAFYDHASSSCAPVSAGNEREIPYGPLDLKREYHSRLKRARGGKAYQIYISVSVLHLYTKFIDGVSHQFKKKAKPALFWFHPGRPELMVLDAL